MLYLLMNLELEYSVTILFKTYVLLCLYVCLYLHLYRIHIQIHQYHDINFKLKSFLTF